MQNFLKFENLSYARHSLLCSPAVNVERPITTRSLLCQNTRDELRAGATWKQENERLVIREGDRRNIYPTVETCSVSVKTLLNVLDAVRANDYVEVPYRALSLHLPIVRYQNNLLF